MFGNKDYSDDLINEKVEPIIIKQDGGSDKKFIYTIIILLVLLFILALGVIAFLGSKYFSSQNKSAPIVNSKPIVQKTLNTMQVEEKEAIKKAVVVTPKKVEKPEQKADTNDLEQLIAQEESNKAKPAKENAPSANNNVQQAVSSVANKVAGTKLSKEDLATIAKLVAAELQKSNSQNKIEAKGEDKNLVQALQAAPTDTLKEQNVDVSKVAKGDVKAKVSDKKVDTFNKVVVKPKTNGDDEFAKLTQEIDSILQSKDVQQVEQSNKYNKIIQAETEQREKELRFYVVKRGDTLSSIARKAYGKASLYRKIYEANPDLIKNPNRIYIGMRLRVPAL